MIRAGHLSAASVTLERFVVPLLPRMRDLGMESFLVAGGGGVLDAQACGAPVVRTRIGRGRDMWKGWLSRESSMLDIQEWAPDVLFVHTPATALASWPVLRSLKSAGVRLIYVARGSFDESPSRTIKAAWSATDPMKWDMWDAFIVANGYLAQRAIELQPHAQVVHASLGAASPNTPAARPASVHLESWRARGHLNLGWVGRFDADKRPEDFVSLVERLNERHGVPARGVMIGSALPGDRRRSLEPSASVDLVGWQAKPWEHLALCDLNISTSIREGFGLTPIEAASVGTPSIAYVNHGMAESVPEVLGNLVPQGGQADMEKLVVEYSRRSDDEVSERRRSVCEAAWKRLSTVDPSAEFVHAARGALSA